MKLHLPKMLLIAVMTACSYVQAAMITPTQGTNKYTYVNGGWVKNSDNTSATPSRSNNKGAFMVISESFDADNAGYGDTSDGDGGVWVEDNVSVTNFNLGSWAGSVYVGSGADLTASLQYHQSGGYSIKSGGAENRSNIWVDGSFTLSGLKNFDGNGNDHYWHIGTNGKITLSGTTNIAKNNKAWHIEVVENNFRTATEEELAATLTNRSTTQTTHEFLEAGADLSSFINSVTIILGDGTEYTGASLSGTGGHHTATVNNAIELTTLTWAGTADNDTWTNTGSNWVDSSGAATSFLNGDSVIFGAAAEGISSTVNVGSSVTVNNMAVNGSYTLNIADSASLAVQGALNIAGALEVTGSGSLNGAVVNTGSLAISTVNSSTNRALLIGTEGTGDIILKKDTILNQGDTSLSTGKLIIQDGATLSIATEGLNHDTIKGQNYDLSSFTSVTLNNATLKYVGHTTELQNVTVESGGASLLFKDMSDHVDNIFGNNNADSWYKLTGTTNLIGALNVSKFETGDTWKYAVQIDKLTGNGALNVTSGGEHGYVRVNNASEYTGAISVTKGTGAAAVALRSLSGTIGVSSVTLANGAEIYFEVNSGATATYNGTITGTGALKKTAAGTLNLNSAGSTADIHVNGGTLYTVGTKTLGSGDIYVNSEGTLKLGSDDDHTVVFSDNQKLILNGGKVVWGAQGSKIADVDVTANSDFSFFDMKVDTELVIGSLDIAASTTLTINSNTGTNRWKHWLNVAALSGDGTLSVQGPVNNESIPSAFKIGSLEGFTGHVNVTSNEGGGTKKYHATISTGSEDVDFKSLTFTGYGQSGEDSTAIFNVQGNTNIETLRAAGATVNISAGKTLTIDGTDASVQNSIGTLSSAGKLTYTSSGSMSIGSLSMSGDANLTVSSGAGTLNLTGSVTIAAGSNATLAGSMGLGTTIVNNGTLALNGNFSINEITRLEVAEGTTETFSDGSHGYLNATYKVVDNAGTVTLNGATLNGLTLSGGGNDDVNVMIETSSGDYYVNSASEALVYNTGDTVTSKVAADSTTGIILRGGNLNMVTGLNAAATSGITAARNATINLGGDVTLNQSDLHLSGGTITLTGSGTYQVANDLWQTDKVNEGNLLQSGVTLGNDWKGAVKISNSHVMGIDFTKLGDENSKLHLNGLSTWMLTSQLNVYQSLILENYNTTRSAFIIADSSQNHEYIFHGSVSGSGDFEIATRAGSKSIYTFNGDLSEWKGGIIVNSSYNSSVTYPNDVRNNTPTVDIKLNGSTVFSENTTSGVTHNRGGELNVYIGSGATNEQNVTMNGAIANDGGGTLNLTVQGNTDFQKDVTVTSMTVNAGKTATLTGEANSMVIGNATITSKAGTDAALSNVTVDAPAKKNTISATSTANGTKGSISNADVQIAQLAQDASFTIQDMTLTNTTITAATAETRVNLNNVSGNATLATGTFALQMQAGDPLVGMGGASLSYGVTGTPSLTLGATGASLVITVDPSADVNGIYQDYTLTFNLNVNLDSVPVSVVGWKELVGFDGWLGTMLGNQGATYQVTNGAAQVAEGNSAPTVSYDYAPGDGGSNVGMLTITINGLNVPEPTTSTLSLLALAALAARRRRND